ncbi:MAG: MBL fold metallo-hydrolase [Actinomycetota bacterium]
MHDVPSRRDVLRLAALGVPALAAGARSGRVFAAANAVASAPLRVGTVEITRVVESEGPMMQLSSFFFDAASGASLSDDAVEAHREWLDRWALARDGTMIFSIQSVLVRTRRHVILVDTCAGAGANKAGASIDFSAVPYFQRLRAAGVRPEDVDLVLCTHLHSDHVGWNTLSRDGRLVPTFPKAKYVFDRREWGYWKERKEGDFGYEPIRDRVRPIVDAGSALLVDPPHEIDEEARIEPIYGHTPGQIALRISSGERVGILVGDLMHHPIQCAETYWDSKFSVDSKVSVAARRAFLERHAGTDALVIPAHFPTPGAGRVVAHGKSWRFANVG